MIVGYNEKLEDILRAFQDKDNDVDWADVMTAIVNSVAAGDDWYIPVEMMQEGMNETDYEEGWILDHIPGLIKRTIGTKTGKELMCAFTSPDKFSAVHQEEVMSVRYPAKRLLTEFSQWDSIDGLMLNPWSDDFVIDQEEAEKALAFASDISDRRKQSFRSYRLEPKAVIDTNAILRSWKKGWTDAGSGEENWELLCYPIMSDKRVLVIFEMKDEIHAGKYDSFHVENTYSHFRLLEFGEVNGKLEEIGKYRFMSQNASIGSAFLYDGKLRLAIRDWKNSSYTILPSIPVDDEKQFCVYSNIETMLSDSTGNIIVGYSKNLRDRDRLPVAFFNTEGKIVRAYHDEYALSCLDVNLDRNENVWFHLSPSSTLDRLGEDGRIDESIHLALPGFTCFALSDDLSRLFVSFSEYDGGSTQFILHKNSHGEYTDPIRFEFLPEDENGKRLEVKDSQVFGHCSSMKSWVILNADGRLYLYDINDCVD